MSSIPLISLFLLIMSSFQQKYYFYVASDTPTYGEFDLELESFTQCKGPKRKDCAVAKATIKNGIIKYDMVLPANFKLTKGKVVAMSNGKNLLRLQLENPCSHLFIKPLLQSLVNTTENCIIPKGHYKVDIDLNKIAKSYYHGAFIYGEYNFKSTF